MAEKKIGFGWWYEVGSDGRLRTVMVREVPIVVGEYAVESKVEPPQPEEPQPASPEQQAQGERNPGQDVPVIGVNVPVGPQGPPSPRRKEKTGQRGTECRDRWRLGVEFVALVVGIAGIVLLLLTLREATEATKAATKQAKTADKAFHATQRPYISLGRKDGMLAEYIDPPKGQKQGALMLYFQNSGGGAATSFEVDVRSLGYPGMQARYIGETPIDPAPIVPPGQLGPGIPHGQGIMGSGNTIGAESSFAFPVASRVVPDDETWRRIKAGRDPDPYIAKSQFWGHFEYCSPLGEYHCETFRLAYSPAPVYRFVFVGPTQQCAIGENKVTNIIPPDRRPIRDPTRERRCYPTGEQANE